MSLSPDEFYFNIAVTWPSKQPPSRRAQPTQARRTSSRAIQQWIADMRAQYGPAPEV